HVRTPAHPISPRPQGQTFCWNALWPSVRHCLAVAQRPILRRGHDPLPAGRRHGQLGAQAASTSDPQWLWATLCVDGPQFLDGRCFSLSATRALSLYISVAGSGHKGHRVGRSHGYAGLLALTRYWLVTLYLVRHLHTPQNV